MVLFPVDQERPAGPGGAKRRKLGRIDLDDKIADAKLKEKVAKQAVKATRAEIRNEKRRRSRLVKKAAALSVEDLEQIAKLKKAGLWDPIYGVGADAPVAGGAGSPAAAGVAAAVAEPAAAGVLAGGEIEEAPRAAVAESAPAGAPEDESREVFEPASSAEEHPEE